MVVGVEYLERKVAYFVVTDPKLAPGALLAHRSDMACGGARFVKERSLGIPDGAALRIVGEDGALLARVRPLGVQTCQRRGGPRSGQEMRSLVLALLRGHIERYGCPPSSTQLGRALGKHHSTILYHLRKLRMLGQVTWESGVSGSIRLVPSSERNACSHGQTDSRTNSKRRVSCQRRVGGVWS